MLRNGGQALGALLRTQGAALAESLAQQTQG